MLECTSSPLALKKLTARDWTLPCALADGTAVFTEHEEDQWALRVPGAAISTDDLQSLEKLQTIKWELRWLIGSLTTRCYCSFFSTAPLFSLHLLN